MSKDKQESGSESFYADDSAMDPPDDAAIMESEMADPNDEDDFNWVKSLSKEALAKLKRVANELFSAENGEASVELAKLTLDDKTEAPAKKQKRAKKSSKPTKPKKSSKPKTPAGPKPTTLDVVQLCMSDSLPTHIFPMQDVIGYKSVQVEGASHILGQARLRLRIPFQEASVYNADNNNRMAEPATLRKGRKYSTNRAFVEAAEIFASSPGHLKLALIALQTGNAKLVSKHTSSFVYPLQDYVNERSAGSFKGGPCGPGIYFYLDASDAYSYNNARKNWVISNVIDQKLIVSRLSENESNYTPGDEAELEVAKQRRIDDLREWAVKAIGGDENFAIQ